ncbi:hypothetical protein JCM8547_003110 [Rhodosporidiobolus lusitaniae]
MARHRSHLSLSALVLALLLAIACAHALEVKDSTGELPGGSEEDDSGERVASGGGTDFSSSEGGQLDGRASVQGVKNGGQRLGKRAAWPSPIPIRSSLPSTSSLSSSFVSSYDSLLSSLNSSAESLVSSSLSHSLTSRLTGVPGTGITSSSESRALQSYLDCTSSRGEWVYEPHGAHLARHGSGLTVHKQEGRYAACEKRFYKGREVGAGVEEGEWHVRESLKWRWVPSPSCAELAPPSLSSFATYAAVEEGVDSGFPPLSRTRFCHLLAHKSTLLLGDSTQYSLHDLLLDWTATEPQSCYGDLYCKEHALCGEILKKTRKSEEERVEKWEDDERVYHRLPLPPGAERKKEKRALDQSAVEEDDHIHPHSHLRTHPRDSHSSLSSLSKRQSPHSPSYGTLLRYRRTDGLRPATAYTLPTYKHPFTGIREINQQWLADSRRSDLVVLTKPPLPMPLRGHNGTWDAWVRDVIEADEEEVSLETKGMRMLEAAADVTLNVWLAELLEALRAIRAPPSPADQLVVYRSGWREHADCAASSSSLDEDEDDLAPPSPGDGPPPHPSQPSLSSLLFRRSRCSPSSASSRSGKAELALLPPHILFHNLQLLLQNHLLRTLASLLPALGIPFLDLETPLSVWRGGMVGSSAGAPFVSSSSSSQTTFSAPPPGLGLRSPASGDCTRYCFPSPGGAVEEFFLGALGRVFEAGWAGDGREKEWMGDEGFRNLRERVAEREKGGGGA